MYSCSSLQCLKNICDLSKRENKWRKMVTQEKIFVNGFYDKFKILQNNKISTKLVIYYVILRSIILFKISMYTRLLEIICK